MENAYGHADEEIEAWRTRVKDAGFRILKVVPDIEPVCRDPVIAVAIEVKADYIVSGDKDLLALDQYKNIQFVGQ